MANITKQEIKQIVKEALNQLITETINNPQGEEGQYLVLKIVQNGMEVSLTPEGIEEAQEWKNKTTRENGKWVPMNLSDIDIWQELGEDIVGNSDWQIGTADEFGQMSEAPCVITGSEYNEEMGDDGEYPYPKYIMHDDARMFYYEPYAIHDLIDELLKGPVFFNEAI